MLLEKLQGTKGKEEPQGVVRAATSATSGDQGAQDGHIFGLSEWRSPRRCRGSNTCWGCGQWGHRVNACVQQGHRVVSMGAQAMDPGGSRGLWTGGPRGPVTEADRDCLWVAQDMVSECGELPSGAGSETGAYPLWTQPEGPGACRYYSHSELAAMEDVRIAAMEAEMAGMTVRESIEFVPGDGDAPGDGDVPGDRDVPRRGTRNRRQTAFYAP